MSTKAIEAEVSIRSGIDAEVEVGRGITVNVADVTLESLAVTENGQYVPGAGVDGYDRVTVNVIPPTDPNVIEGEFIGTETGILTIDLPYKGEDFPKAIMIHAADGIVKDDLDRPYVILAYCIFKNTDGEPTYDGSGVNNAFRCQSIYISTGTYTTWSGTNVYTFSQADPSVGFLNSVRMPDNKTLKICVNSGGQYNAKFTTGIRYTYQIFY